MSLAQRFDPATRRGRLVRRFAGAAFLFFLLKGLVWLGLAAAAAWAALR